MRLHRLVTRHWQLKVTALALAVVLWMVAAVEAPGSRLITAELVVQLRDGRTVVSTPASVVASVVGPGRELLKLGARRVILTKVLADSSFAGPVTVELSPGDLQLPRGIAATVQDLQPRQVAVELDSMVARRFDGIPVLVTAALGAERRARPAEVSVVVEGPARRLQRLSGESLHVTLREPHATRDAADLRVLFPAGLSGSVEPARVRLEAGGRP